jgi:hypothetical protein
MSAFNRAALPGWPSYADDRGMKLVGRGRWRTTRCDLHGGSDSLRVNTESGGWCCMACGAHGGDVLSHYMQITDADFREGALALGAWDQTKDRHTEREARTLAPRDAMEVIARELGVAVVVISDARSGLVPSDADWRRFLVAAGTVEKLVMEFRS